MVEERIDDVEGGHAPEGFKKCPECLHGNRNDANKCRSCGYTFPRQETSSGKNWKRRSLVMLSILGVIGIIAMMAWRNGTTTSTSSSSPGTSTVASRTVAPTQKPSCDKGKVTKLIGKLKAEGIIYRIDAPSGLYPRVYVTEAWRALPMDQKRAVDGVLYCWGSVGGANDILIKYYDYRTEKKIALGGRDGLSLQ